MRPHTGLGRVQPQKGELGQPPITCLSRQGHVRLHANRLIFYFGLACKSSRAKPHCNTRSHRLHGLTSLARNKHTQNQHETPPAFSSAWAFRVYLSEHFFHLDSYLHPQSSPHFFSQIKNQLLTISILDCLPWVTRFSTTWSFHGSLLLPLEIVRDVKGSKITTEPSGTFMTQKG